MSMDPPVTYHEWQTQVLEMKRAMLRTVLIYCAWGLGAAMGFILLLVGLQSFLWADFWNFLRSLWH
jgi:hypothetical protein